MNVDAEIVRLARAEFERYAAGPVSEMTPFARLQCELAAWRGRRFGATPDWQPVMGASEEIGELAEPMVTAADTLAVFVRLVASVGKLNHATLKAGQKLRDMHKANGPILSAVGDASADTVIFLFDVATHHRLDLWTLVRETAQRVMARAADGIHVARTAGDEMVSKALLQPSPSNPSPHPDDAGLFGGRSEF